MLWVLIWALFISTLPNGWGKVPRHNCQCLLQIFGCCYPLASNTPLIFFLPLPPLWVTLCSSPWTQAMKVRWGSHDFCPVVTNFHMQVITQEQLNALSQSMAWGDVEKPWEDMVFLLIMPSITTGCKRVFGIVTVWAHPHEAHHWTLEEVAHKLVLLEDKSVDWAYSFI